jgi:hypothetical protein
MKELRLLLLSILFSGVQFSSGEGLGCLFKAYMSDAFGNSILKLKRRLLKKFE